MDEISPRRLVRKDGKLFMRTLAVFYHQLILIPAVPFFAVTPPYKFFVNINLFSMPRA